MKKGTVKYCTRIQKITDDRHNWVFHRGLRKMNTMLYITIFRKVMHQSKDSRNQYSVDSVCHSVCLYLTWSKMFKTRWLDWKPVETDAGRVLLKMHCSQVEPSCYPFILEIFTIYYKEHPLRTFSQSFFQTCGAQQEMLPDVFTLTQNTLWVTARDGTEGGTTCHIRFAGKISRFFWCSCLLKDTALLNTMATLFFGRLCVALCKVLRLMTPALTQKTPNRADDTSSNVKNTPHQSALKTPTL